MDTKRTSAGWALALTCVAGFMTALDLLVVATALPAMQHDLHAGLAELSWIVNAYQLALAAGIISAAALGDRLGRRRVFVAGLGLFTVASAACALAPSPAILIAARALQGAGAAAVAPLGLTILASAFPSERRGAAIGAWAGVAGLAVAGGPLVGGALTQGISWHWIFWVNVPIGIAVCTLAARQLEESRGERAPLDPAGLVLVSAGTALATWGLVGGGAAALAGGAGLLAGFALWERRARAPMLPPHLFRNVSFAAANASGFLMTASLIPAAYVISRYLQLVLHLGPLAAGLAFLPMTATPLVVAPVAGMLSSRLGARRLIAGGLLLLALGLGWFALGIGAGAAYPVLAGGLLLAGVGVSMPFATVATAALAAVQPADLGRASGVTNTLRNFGGAFGIALSTAVLAGGGFRAALVAAALVAVAGALAGLAVRDRLPVPAISRKRRDPQPRHGLFLEVESGGRS
jgi:EmrB/QacA subfamily drug resistance transporter